MTGGIDLGVLGEIIGEKNIEKIRDAIADLIIENIRSSVDYNWLVPPEEALEVIDSMWVRVAKKVCKEYEGEAAATVRAMVEESLERKREK